MAPVDKVCAGRRRLRRSAFFVNAAHVSVIDDYFLNASAIGGPGGAGAVGLGDGGGGGLGGNGGTGGVRRRRWRGRQHPALVLAPPEVRATREIAAVARGQTASTSIPGTRLWLRRWRRRHGRRQERWRPWRLWRRWRRGGMAVPTAVLAVWRRFICFRRARWRASAMEEAAGITAGARRRRSRPGDLR